MTQEPAQPGTLDPLTPAAGTQIWEQQPGEPNRWYDRFHRFMLDGRRRTVLSVYLDEWRREKARKGARADDIQALRQPLTIPGSWGKMVAAWSWRERAAAYDAYLRQQEDEEFAEERRQDRRNRILADRGLRGWGISQIPHLPQAGACVTCGHPIRQHAQAAACTDEGCTCPKYQPVEVDAYAVIKAIVSSNQELRKEYGDEPAQRLQHEGTVGNVVLNTTPNDLADKSDDELEEEIGQFAALLRHLPAGPTTGASTPEARDPPPGYPGTEAPPLDEP